MRAAAPVTHLAAWLLAVVCILAPGCKSSPTTKGRGVFYQRTDTQLVPMLRGSVTEMAARAIPISGTVRPSFLIDLPRSLSDFQKAHVPDVRIAVELEDNKAGPFKPVDVTVTAVEGQEGAYRVRPNADLPPGLCAVVLGAGDELSADGNNVFPFRIADEQAPH